MLSIRMPDDTLGHAAPITDVAMSRHGFRLATASYDGTVIVWDYQHPDKPEMVCRIRHRRLVNSVAWNPVRPDLLASASADKTAAVWCVSDAGDVSVVSVLARHTDDVNSVAWMPSGTELICVSEDGRATRWDAMSGAFRGEVTSHTAHCMDVSVSGDGLIATVGEDGVVTVVGGMSGEDQRQVALGCSVEGCAWSPSGQALAVACDDGSVLLLDTRLRRLQRIEVSTSAVRSVAWTEDDTSLVAGAYDGAFYFIERDRGCVGRLRDDRLWPRSLDTGAGKLVTGSFGATPAIFDIATARPLSAPPVATHGPNAVVGRAGGLYIGCDSGHLIRIAAGGLRSTTGSRVTVSQLAESPILALAADGRAVYAGTYSGMVIRTSGERALRTARLDAPVTSLCLAGERLIAGTYNGELVRLDPSDLTVEDRAVRHGGSVKSLATVTDGVFASAATDQVVAIGTFDERAPLWRHGNLVNAVASGEGGVIASAARDHTVKVGRVRQDPTGGWEVTGSQTLLGPDESVKCVAVLGDPRNPVVLAGAYDFRLYYWHLDRDGAGSVLRSGAVLAEFDQALSHMVALRRDLAAVASWDGRVALVSLTADGSPRLADEYRVAELLARAQA